MSEYVRIEIKVPAVVIEHYRKLFGSFAGESVIEDLPTAQEAVKYIELAQRHLAEE